MYLEKISTKGKRAARTVLYGRVLLLLDAGEHGPKWLFAKVGEALGTTPRSLEHLKKMFVEKGLAAAIERKTRVKPPGEIQFGGEFEVQLLAIACSEVPDGRKRWIVKLLAEKMIELKIVDTVFPMTACKTLKKMNLSLT